jgi:hypothetical protein
MSFKTDFLKNQNISLLWDILWDENTMIKNGSKQFGENILKVFKDNIIPFYESESNKGTSLFDMNKKYIMFILNYINNNSKNSHSEKPLITKQKTDEKVLITYEEIQNNRQSQFEQDLNKRQNEFTNAMTLPIPPVPDFSIKLDDEPIKEISETIKQMTAQRNYDIEQINKTYLQSQQNFLKPQETSIKNEKLTPILSKANTNNTNNTNNIINNLKYIKIDNNQELDSSIYRSQVIDLNTSQEVKKHVSWDNVMEYEMDNKRELKIKEQRINKNINNGSNEEINIFSKLKKVNYLGNDNNNDNNNSKNINKDDKSIVLQEEIENMKIKIDSLNDNVKKIMELLDNNNRT